MLQRICIWRIKICLFLFLLVCGIINISVALPSVVVGGKRMNLRNDQNKHISVKMSVYILLHNQLFFLLSVFLCPVSNCKAQGLSHEEQLGLLSNKERLTIS